MQLAGCSCRIFVKVSEFILDMISAARDDDKTDSKACVELCIFFV